MSSFRFQLKDNQLHNMLKDTRKLFGDKTNTAHTKVSYKIKSALIDANLDYRQARPNPSA